MRSLFGGASQKEKGRRRTRDLGARHTKCVMEKGAYIGADATLDGVFVFKQGVDMRIGYLGHR